MKIIWLKDRKAPMFIINGSSLLSDYVRFDRLSRKAMIENNETQTLFLEISVLFFRHTNGATAVINV